VTILVMSGSDPLAKALAGWMIDQVGVQELMVACGVVQMAVSVGAMLIPAVRRYGGINTTER
jgi:hypothetical protein